MAEPSVATRNNNPLNIKYGSATKKYVESGDAEIGEKAKDGGNFLKFKNSKIGFTAANDLLFNNFYKDFDIDSAMRKWSNDGYGGSDILPDIDPTTKISDLNDDQKKNIISNMAKREGFNIEETKEENLKKNLKTYKITDKETGEVFSVKFPSKPTTEQLNNIVDLRNKTQEKGQKANLEYKNRPFTAKLADVLYAPSEYLAPAPKSREEVEQLPLSERLLRLGQETLSGITSPQNLPAVAAPLLTGPVGAAASGIVYGPAMLHETLKSGYEAYEHPSVETIGRTALSAAGTALAGAGIKEGFSRGYEGRVATPEVKPPRPQLVGRTNQLALPESNPIDAEFVDQPQISGDNTLKLLNSTNLDDIFNREQGEYQAPREIESPQIKQLGTGEGQPIVTPPPTENITGQKLISSNEPKQIEGTIQPRTSSGAIVSPPSNIESTIKEPQQISGQILGDQKLLDPYYGGLNKNKTATLLVKRTKASGKELQYIEDILKRRGAFPDPNEIVEIPDEIKDVKEPEQNADKSEEMVRVYRGESPIAGKSKIPSWMDKNDNLGVQAGRRWVTDNLENAKWYQKEAGDTGEINYIDIPKKIWEQAKNSPESLRFSRRPEQEGFIPKEYVSKFKKLEEAPKAKLENEWLRNQETNLLHTMREGATGELKQEIDSVLNERGIKTESKTSKLHTEISDEEEGKPKLNEELFTKYQSKLDDLVSEDHVDSATFQEIAQMGKDAGLDEETVAGDIIDNTPRISNNTGKAQNATRKVFNSDEKGFGTIDFFLGKWAKKAKGTEAEEPINNAIKSIGFFARSLPKPERVIGKMGKAGAKLERMIEDAQYESDKLKGHLDILIHDSFKGLTSKEIGQRIAVLDNGKEIPLTKDNMDNYVTWDNGVFTPKSGVKKIIRMKGSLSNVILDNAEPANEKIADSAQQFRQAMEILGDSGEKSGVSTISSSGKYIPFEKQGMDYWPRDYTEGFFQSLERDPRDFNKIVKDVAKEKGVTIKEAENLLKNKKTYSEVTTRGQHQRTFKQDSFVIDPNTILDHISSFTGRIGMAKALGPEDVKGSLVGDELIKLMNEGWDWKFASDTIARLVGRENEKNIPGKTESTLYKAITNLNNARLMTSFVINNLANATTTFARVGEVNTLKGLGAYLGNMEVSRRMATLSGAVEHTGALEQSGTNLGKMLGIPLSEKFMRTWADQSGRITAEGLVNHLNEIRQSSPEFIRGKRLLDSILGKDSTEVIERGGLTKDELNRAGWQLSKDSQGIINPATMPPMFENVQNPGLRLMANLAMQYKRMAMLGMDSLVESFKLNPARTIRTLTITAPIIGELIGDAGSAIFGSVAGTITGEGGKKAAIRDVQQRGKALSNIAKPLLQEKLGLTPNESLIASRYIEDLNRGFALGLIGDFMYSIAYWGEEAASDVISGGIAPAWSFIYDIAKSIMDSGKSWMPLFDRGEKVGKNLAKVVAPQRLVSAINRSEKTMKGNSQPIVKPPSLPR